MHNPTPTTIIPAYRPWIFIPLQHRLVLALPKMVRPVLYVLPLLLLVFPLYSARPVQYAVNWPISYGIHIAILIIYLGILVLEAYLGGPYKEFWELIATECANDNHRKYTEIMHRGTYLAEGVMVVWTVILVTIFLLNTNSLIYLRVSKGFADPLLYTMSLAVVLFGMVTGGGLGLAAFMIFGIYTVSKHSLLGFKPMHPDKAGGYSCIGRYSFRTVASLSLGVLFLPTLIEFSQLGEGLPAIVIMLVVILYTFALAFAFASPIVCAYHSAERTLKRLTGEYAVKYEQQIMACLAHPSEDKTFTIAALESYLNKLQSIRPYPFQMGTLFKMVATSLLPVLVFLLQMVVGSEYFSALVNQSLEQWFSL